MDLLYYVILKIEAMMTTSTSDSEDRRSGRRMVKSQRMLRLQNCIEQLNIMGPSTTIQLMSTRLSKNSILVNGFTQLGDDLCLKILGWVSTDDLWNLSKVSKRFESLCWNAHLWKKIHFRGTGAGICSADSQLQKTLKQLLLVHGGPSLPFVEEVHFNNNCKVTDKGLGMLSRRCPELTHLHAQFCPVTNEGVSEILAKCTNLRHLDLTGCVDVTVAIDTANFSASQLPALCRYPLQYLDLTDCVSIDDSSLLAIVRQCPQLVYLYLRRCVQLSDVALKYIPSYCGQLRELSLSDCVLVSDFGLYELAKLGVTLRYLSVAKCGQVSDPGLKMIARRCYKLR